MQERALPEAEKCGKRRKSTGSATARRFDIFLDLGPGSGDG